MKDFKARIIEMGNRVEECDRKNCVSCNYNFNNLNNIIKYQNKNYININTRQQKALEEGNSVNYIVNYINSNTRQQKAQKRET